MVLSHLRANAVAYLALAVAASTGTAYAADQIANGSVTSQKLAKNAVTSPKIKTEAVKSADIKNGTIGARDIAGGVLPTGLALSGEGESGSPAAVPDLPDNRTHAFTSGGGQTYIQFAFNRVGMTCSSGSAFLGLYLDGSPVPGTRYAVPAAGAERAVIVGAVVATAPGGHTASIGLDCPSGTNTSATHTDSTWFVATPRP